MLDDKNIFIWETMSNAAPFVSDSGWGTIRANNAMLALREVVKTYKHPMGLYSACIKDIDNRNLLARYLSSRAATLANFHSGAYRWGGKTLYVNEKEVPLQLERYELVTLEYREVKGDEKE